jgi:hypothetical protein
MNDARENSEQQELSLLGRFYHCHVSARRVSNNNNRVPMQELVFSFSPSSDPCESNYSIP